jgi:hypothetical protein
MSSGSVRAGIPAFTTITFGPIPYCPIAAKSLFGSYGTFEPIR